MKSTIPASLLKRNIFNLGGGSAEDKAKFHADGKKFLKAFAAEIGVADACEISSCLGGPGVLGEVGLHADSLYLTIFESIEPGVRIMYRSCKGRKDHTGGPNMYVTMKDINEPDALARFVATCKRMATATA
jgi:hypothetical protein